MGGRARSAADSREHASGTLSVTGRSLIRGGGPPWTFTTQGPAARGSIWKEPQMLQSEATGSAGREQGRGFGAHCPTYYGWGKDRASVLPTGSPSSVTAASIP